MRVQLKYRQGVIGKEELDRGIYNIGRGQHSGLSILGPGFDERGTVFGEPDDTVSRLKFTSEGVLEQSHLTMKIEPDNVRLVDNSLNGSFLNGQKMKKDEEKALDEQGIYELSLGIGHSRLWLILGE